MNQPSSEFRDQVTAIHEAAHAVAFIVQGQGSYIKEVHIEGVGLTLGSLEVNPGLRFPIGTEDPDHLATIEKLCIAFLVAKPAEMKWLRQERPGHEEELYNKYRWESGVSDIEDAAEVAAQRFASNNPEELIAYLKYIWMRAKAFRDDTEHWFIVKRLAAALVAMRRIDAKLLARLIDSARREYQRSGVLVKTGTGPSDGRKPRFLEFVRDCYPICTPSGGTVLRVNG